MLRRRVQVHGAVQGVGFRYSARLEAERRGVAGWIRNLPDGRVEAAGTAILFERTLSVWAMVKLGEPGFRVTG